jgi:mono/diheme cytochrome c family protein
MHASWTTWTALVGVLAVACSDAQDSGATSPLVEQGRRVYQNVCIACHNGDPRRTAGRPGDRRVPRASSSRRGAARRIPARLHAEAAGKCDAALPYLANDIDALAAYLQASAARCHRRAAGRRRFSGRSAYRMIDTRA